MSTGNQRQVNDEIRDGIHRTTKPKTGGIAEKTRRSASFSYVLISEQSYATAAL
jgi:hypothetical protein